MNKNFDNLLKTKILNHLNRSKSFNPSCNSKSYK